MKKDNLRLLPAFGFTFAMFAAPFLLTCKSLAAEPGPQLLTLNQAIEICRTIYFIDPAKGKAMFDAVPEEQKQSVAAVCLGYRDGAEDMLQIITSKRPEPVKWGR